MGHPKRLSKKYEPPKRPFEKLEEERQIMKEFGLKKKEEIWRAETELRRIRRMARELQALKGGKEEKEIPGASQLIRKINNMGIPVKSLDDVLGLKLHDILSRRLQTIAFKKGIGNTIKHTRQLIVHGHVLIGGRKAKFPSMIVSAEDEDKIKTDIKTPLPAKKEKEVKNEPESQAGYVEEAKSKEENIMKDEDKNLEESE